ncbi:WAT1-related protein [Apostasia shenzhenica]|uniref:WAT1-related protein n=1 Tax=Apostasia shenzhenica TaxID=1088818 RepID=A0A2I0A832_9ASPA|nr:WAT1-related protein [Apostasia shenzhenica]
MGGEEAGGWGGGKGAAGSAGSRWSAVEGLKPAAGMVVIQIVFAGVNVFYKLAINDGMDMRILVAYRYLFATASLGPFAFFLERKTRPRLTWKILIQAFFCGLFGGTLAQNLYVSSIKLTSATFASAMTNLIPAITFIMAVMFRLESLRIRSSSGKAKLLGTLIGVSGAMILTFFKGKELNLSTSINLLKPHSSSAAGVPPQYEPGNRVLGSIMAIASCFSYAIWLIIQAKMIQAYPCHYSSTALMCLMGSIQAAIFALCMGTNWEQWRMGFGIRLYSVAYSGVVASGLILSVLAWCIKKKGPLYASVFNPLMLVVVAIFGSLFLNEKLHVGSVVGAALIVVGLYSVLWGKRKEGDTAKVVESHAGAIDVVVEPRELQNGSGLPASGAEPPK